MKPRNRENSLVFNLHFRELYKKDLGTSIWQYLPSYALAFLSMAAFVFVPVFHIQIVNDVLVFYTENNTSASAGSSQTLQKAVFTFALGEGAVFADVNYILSSTIYCNISVYVIEY